ncbi:hypothetical protein GGS20DRAFT_582552 [Poronia punctata]|nr:hypothetical protein GGS20DRAFT_582552 [Poronia punctata]
MFGSSHNSDSPPRRRFLQQDSGPKRKHRYRLEVWNRLDGADSRLRASVFASHDMGCDEVRPVCGNCARRYFNVEKCDYAPVPTRAVRSRRLDGAHENARASIQVNSSTPSTMTLTPKPAGLAISEKQRSLEMRLFFHYTQFTAAQLPAAYGNTTKELWLDKAPQMAFRSDMLLDAIMTISAMHLQDLSPGDPKLPMVITHYLDRTLAKHRYNLAHPDPGMIGPMVLTAFLVCVTSWLLTHRSSLASEPYRIPVNVFAFTRGCCTLQRKHSTGLRGLITKPTYRESGIWELVSKENVDMCHHPAMLGVRRDLDELLEGFDVASMPPTEAKTYHSTREYVITLFASCFLDLDSAVLQKLVFTMALPMETEFLPLLQAGDPLALALYARIMVALNLIDRSWWSQGAKGRSVLDYSIRGISTLMPPKCLWALEWPLQVIAGDVKLTAAAEPAYGQCSPPPLTTAKALT